MIPKITTEWLKENHERIYFFGLGFIQVKINDEYRIHFYTNKWNPTVQEEEVHNHRYSFTSKILKGSLTQTFYSLVPGNKFVLSKASSKPDQEGKFDSTEAKYDLLTLNTETHHAGSSYTLLSDTFHRVQAQGDTITLLQRGPYEKLEADVVYPVDYKIMCPFSVKVSEEDLWNEIERMLND